MGIASNLFKLLLDEGIKRGHNIFRLHGSKQGKSIYKRFGFIDSDGYMIMKL